MESNVLLINCRDEPGLVSKITGALYRQNLNVISNGEFVEKNYNHFFMRTEFAGEYDHDALLNQLQVILPTGAERTLTPRKKKNIIIMVTKEHHCLSDLLIRHAFNELDANIQCVISNYKNLEDLSRKFDIPFYLVSHDRLERREHEAEILKIIRQHNPELIVLAKYMRVLSPEFVAGFTNRIINIHHSFLPAFAGANPYAQAYERGVKIIGATAHFVNSNLDDGPIIAQNIMPVAHTHSAKEMAQAGRDVEKIVLARSLKLAVEERIFVYRNKTIIFD